MLFGNMITLGALSVRPDGTYVPFSGEAWVYAGQMTLLGMVMIFAVLGLLWGVLSLFKIIFAPKKKKAKKTAEPSVAVSEDKPIAAPVQEVAPKADGNADAELVAIITAAVAAYMAEDGEAHTGGFRVVSFKRVRSGRTWNS